MSSHPTYPKHPHDSVASHPLSPDSCLTGAWGASEISTAPQAPLFSVLVGVDKGSPDYFLACHFSSPVVDTAVRPDSD
jgi:hypothetical protein